MNDSHFYISTITYYILASCTISIIGILMDRGMTQIGKLRYKCNEVSFNNNNTIDDGSCATNNNGMNMKMSLALIHQYHYNRWRNNMISLSSSYYKKKNKVWRWYHIDGNNNDTNNNDSNNNITANNNNNNNYYSWNQTLTN